MRFFFILSSVVFVPQLARANNNCLEPLVRLTWPRKAECLGSNDERVRVPEGLVKQMVGVLVNDTDSQTDDWTVFDGPIISDRRELAYSRCRRRRRTRKACKIIRGTQSGCTLDDMGCGAGKLCILFIPPTANTMINHVEEVRGLITNSTEVRYEKKLKKKVCQADEDPCSCVGDFGDFELELL